MGRRIAWFFRAGTGLVAVPLAALLIYGLVALLGALPLVTPLPPPGPPGRIEPPIRIYVVSNGVHMDLVVPIYAAGLDWSLELLPGHFQGAEPARAAYAGFGWGDRDFYLTTPTLAQLSLATALRSLFASRASLMHVTLWGGAPAPGPAVRALDLIPAQYAALTDALGRSFRRDEAGRVEPIPVPGYDWSDAFYEGVGHYSLITTCNDWAAAQLRRIGVPVGWWSPFPFGVMWNL